MASDFQRYAILLEYDGSYFHGWQRQPDCETVQSVLETALKNFCGVFVIVYGSSRTDAGVHALGQVAHFDLPIKFATIDVNRICSALNFYLHDKFVSVLCVRKVSSSFSSRFSAVSREYRYRVSLNKYPSPLRSGRTYCVHKDLDINLMRKGARYLVGNHDFTTFRSARCQSQNPQKTLTKVSIDYLSPSNEVYFLFSAPSFMQTQIRSMVGSLLQVGSGRWSPARIGEILSLCDRSLCGCLSPAHGLYLLRVLYEARLF